MKRIWIGGTLLIGLGVAVLHAAASYPASVKSFATRVDGQTIAASWFNEIQDEIVAIENGLIGGFAHTIKPLTDEASDLGTSSLRWRIGFFDNGSASAPSVAVSEGDVGLFSSGANALDFTTNGVKALGIDSTQFIDSPTQPRAVAFNNAVQAVSDATATALTFNSEDLDVGAMHDTGSNTSRVTIPAGGDGFYQVVGGTTFAADADGYRQLFIRKNGTTALAYAQVPVNSGSLTTVMQVQFLGTFAAADYVELIATHTAGAALNVGSATRAEGSSLSVVKKW